MNFDVTFIHGLLFGIAHADTLFVEHEDSDIVEEATGVVLMLGFIQIVFYW